MFRLIALGVLAGLFFSTTFVLNEVMSAGGGHWFWSASLRYVFMFVLLQAIIVVRGGWAALRGVWALFGQHALFWMVAGSIGFGGFYALICYSADHAPGWVVAGTWQFTVVAGLFVLMAFGRRFPARVWFYALIVFAGVCAINVGDALADAQHGAARAALDWQSMALAAVPALLAGFCYPLGNQLVWEAQHADGEARRGLQRWVPAITSDVLHDALHKVCLLTIGSLPFWLVLGVVAQPPAPSTGQVWQTAAVALFSGVIATGIFLYARSLASTPDEIAGVDASQASEMLFALLGGVLFLGSAPPSAVSWLGIALVVLGLWLFAQHRSIPLRKSVISEA